MFENTEIISLILIALSFLLLMAIALVIFFFLSRKKIINAELEKANMEISFQKEMLQATILTQEKERKRIAQDLHDAISSKLNIVSLNTNVLLEGGVDVQQTNEMLGTILQISNSTLESSRRIAHDLLPPVLQKFGLKAAVEELTNDYNRAHDGLITLKNDYQPDSLEAKEELHLFRIIQELVNNSLKHGAATQINIELKSQPPGLNYSDNGIGFENTASAGKPGLGMKNIESRVALLGGQSRFESEAGNGIRFTLNNLRYGK
ncbi:sensor histidine kinase [Gilvibacter sediminis]|uniref:sensor histidine kinase n=1 Tax=Gilvibacter sediminis TaxID=379071 RepID=UPI00234FF98B|nr:histidine kinase [Gilvibacter sediminis]MDC7998096.1 histidine kinase [Gilvibacter sediminis]